MEDFNEESEQARPNNNEEPRFYSIAEALKAASEEHLLDALQERNYPFASEEDEQILSFFREHGSVLTGEALQEYNALKDRCKDLETQNEQLRRKISSQMPDEMFWAELGAPTISLVRCIEIIEATHVQAGLPSPTPKMIRHAYSEWIGPTPGTQQRGRRRKEEEISLTEETAKRFLLWYMKKLEDAKKFSE